jgi:hypothetical protein
MLRVVIRRDRERTSGGRPFRRRHELDHDRPGFPYS